jgi:hypothetical protein
MISCHIIIVDYIFDKINKSLCHMFMDEIWMSQLISFLPDWSCLPKFLIISIFLKLITRGYMHVVGYNIKNTAWYIV